MKNLNTYITEKLYLNKDIEIVKNNIDCFEELPEINSKVLGIWVSKKTPRDSYVKIDIYEVCDYEDDSVLLRKLNSNNVLDGKFKIRTKEDLNKIQQKTQDNYYFAELNKPDNNWFRVFSKLRGLDILHYSRRQLVRGFQYIYLGYKFDFMGDKDMKHKKICDLMSELLK